MIYGKTSYEILDSYRQHIIEVKLLALDSLTPVRELA
ncbi:hypothetical protein QK887_24940, partial [Salmonella enterica subsp. enterica serovar Oslo]